MRWALTGVAIAALLAAPAVGAAGGGGHADRRQSSPDASRRGP